MKSSSPSPSQGQGQSRGIRKKERERERGSGGGGGGGLGGGNIVRNNHHHGSNNHSSNGNGSLSTSNENEPSKRVLFLLEAAQKEVEHSRKAAKLSMIRAILRNEGGLSAGMSGGGAQVVGSGNGGLGLEAAKNAIMWGESRRGILPLDSLFDTTAPDSLKLEVIDLLMDLLGTAFKGQGLPPATVFLVSFFHWIFERLNSEEVSANHQGWMLELLKEVLDPPSNNKQSASSGMENFPIVIPPSLVREEIYAPLIKYFNLLDQWENVEGVMMIFQVLKNNYTEIFYLHFSKVIDVMVGWTVDPETPAHITDKLLSVYFKEFWQFWNSKEVFEHGINLLGNLVYDIEEIFGISLEPGSEKVIKTFPPEFTGLEDEGMHGSTSVLICRTLLSILESVINGMVSSVTGGMAKADMYEQVENILEWFISIISLVCFSLPLNGSFVWLKFVYDSARLSIQSARSTNSFLVSKCNSLIQRHFSNLKDYFELERDVKIIDSWLQILLQVPNSGIPFFIQELFLYPDRDNFLLSTYRVDILDSNTLLSNLEVVCVKIARSRPVVSSPLTIRPTFLSEAHSCFNWISYFLADSRIGSKAVEKPAMETCIMSNSIGKHRKLLAFDITLVSSLAVDGLAGMNASETAMKIYFFLEAAAESLDWTAQHWWHEIEGMLISNLYFVAKGSGFFLPRLNLPPGSSVVEHDDLFHQQFEILLALSRPNHYGQNLIGLVWIRDIVSFCSDKNFLDTDVNESEVLLKIEQVLTSFLKFCIVEMEPRVRTMVGQVWKLYLEAFSSNRRGMSNSCELISSIVSRFHDIDEEAQDAFSDCFFALDPFDTLMVFSKMTDPIGVKFRKLVLSSSPSPCFKSAHVATVLSYLGLASKIQISDFSPVSINSRLADWLPGIFCLCKSSIGTNEFSQDIVDSLVLTASISLDYMMYWVLWETAKFFILGRLKTPLGNANQTLEALEWGLDSYILLSRSDEILPNPVNTILERQSNIILLLEMLEIQYRNAATGCSSFTPPPPKPCILFFNSNQSVCNTWFEQIRSKVIHCAGLVENDGAIIKDGYSLLSSLLSKLVDSNERQDRLKVKEATVLLFQLASSLSKMGDYDGISGLAKYWIKLTAKVDPDYFDGTYPQYLENLSLLTKGIVENGTIENILFLETIRNISNEEYVLKVENAIINGYESIHSWSDATAVIESLPSSSSLKGGEDQERLFQLDQLRVWQKLRVWQQPKSENETLYGQNIFKGGISLFLETTSLAKIAEIDNKVLTNVASLRKSLNLMKRTASVNISKNISEVAESLIFGQSLFKALHVVDYSKGKGVKLRSSKPKDRITGDSIIAKTLPLWIKSYDMARLFQEANGRDPDLNEIGGLMANMARKTQNLKLSKRLIADSQTGLTSSGEIRFKFKKARLFQAEGSPKEASLLLLDVIAAKTPETDLIGLETQAKACTLFARWNTPATLDMKSSSIKAKIESAIHKTLEEDVDSVAYCFLQHATVIAPQTPKSWFVYAGFCYSSARKMLEELSAYYSEDQVYFVQEFKQIRKIVSATPHLVESFCLCLLDLLGETREGTSSKSELWRVELNEDDVDVLEEILQGLLSRVFGQFRMASNAYFTYLKVNTNSSAFNEADEVTATLRLLRLFVRYCIPLESTFCAGFVDTPISPWKSVIPQLFSRLQNPEKLVRFEVSNLLSRIGVQFPHLILYSVLMGIDDKSNTLLSGTCVSILDSIIQFHPYLVQEMHVWMNELQRITILWDELWIMGIEHIRIQLQDRVSRFNHDTLRIQNNVNLSPAERNGIVEKTKQSIFKPITFLLQRLRSRTLGKGIGTPYEQRFAGLFSSRIDKALQAFSMQTDFTNAAIAFKDFNDIYNDIASNFKTSTFNLDDICPILSDFKLSRINVPGLERRDPLFIQSISRKVLCLSTKTKPKRITFNAANGEKYLFLLKGHEDLHLDERIQQFIKVSNLLLRKDKHTIPRSLHSLTYDVIPFGPKFGMIQWISNVTGIFQLVRKSQNWEHASKLLAAKKGAAPGLLPAQPLRPHEQFSFKIQSLMNQGIIDKSASRKKWPPALMKSIFLELQAETASDILAKELWSASDTSRTWWSKTTTFSRSLAVMSILGYLIGLGDRHLDNILVDLNAGNVLHIDFNVCFDKGLNLRIPETVPFRLTSNFVNALGPSGVDGNFRIACEQTLRVMRENREILLTLLETFIFDPLVDWTIDESEESLLLNLNLAITKLSSRVKETRPVLQDLAQQFPIQAETAIYEFGTLLTSSLREFELRQEMKDISSMSTEDLSESINSIEERFIQAKMKFLLQFDSLKGIASSRTAFFAKVVFSLKESLQYVTSSSQIPKYPSSSSLDAAKVPVGANALIDSYSVARSSLFKELEAVIKSYLQLLGSNELLLCSDFFRTRDGMLEAVLEKNFTSTACQGTLDELKRVDSKCSDKLLGLKKEFSGTIDEEATLVKTIDAAIISSKFKSKPGNVFSAGLQVLPTEKRQALCDGLFALIASEIYRLSTTVNSATSFSEELQGFSLGNLDFSSKFLPSIFEVQNLFSSHFQRLCNLNFLVLFLSESFELLAGGLTPSGFPELLTRKPQQSLKNAMRKALSVLGQVFGRLFPLFCLTANGSGNERYFRKFTAISAIARRCLVLDPNSREFSSQFQSMTLLFEEVKESSTAGGLLVDELFLLKTNLINSLPLANANALFLQLVSLLSDMLNDCKNISQWDPTCQFATILSFPQILIQYPVAKAVLNGLANFADLYIVDLGSLVLQPSISLFLKPLTSRKILKTWGATLQVFPESISLEMVSETRKFLNHQIKLGLLSQDHLEASKAALLTDVAGVIGLQQSKFFKSGSKIMRTKLERGEAALARFSYLYQRQLEMVDESFREKNLSLLDVSSHALEGLQAKLLNFKQVTATYDSLVLVNGSKELQETALKRSLTLVDQLERLDNILGLFRNLHEYESQNAYLLQVNMDRDILSALGTMASLKRRLDLIRENGGLIGQISDVQNMLAGLQINDNISTCKKQYKKVSSLIESAKVPVENILQVCETAIKYSKAGLPHQVSKSLANCLNLWKSIKALGKNMSALFKTIQASLEPRELEKMNMLFKSLSSDATTLFTQLLKLSDLKEVTSEDAAAAEEDEKDGDDALLQKEQSKNAIALNVLVKIKEKLDGRNSREKTRLPIPQQVEELLQQATSVENLCQMYEGWNSWI